MRAVGVYSFGGPEALEVVEIPEPRPGPGQIRIRVHAAAVNPTDTVFRSGGFSEALRDRPPPYVPGMDAAGVVDEVGAADGAGGADGGGDAGGWSVGGDIMAIALPRGPLGGAYAEQIVVPAASAARMPAGASYVEASTLPMNGLTAALALDLLGLKPGGTLAVTGGAGAVGGYAIQLAKHAGQRVIADSSPADEALVRGLGADIIVRRGPDVASRIREVVPDGADGLVDAAVIGAPILAAMRDGGGVAAVRPLRGETERGITIWNVRVSSYAHEQAKLDWLRRLAEEKVLSLRVAGTYTPEHAADAHRSLEAGGTRGRHVITFA